MQKFHLRINDVHESEFHMVMTVILLRYNNHIQLKMLPFEFQTFPKDCLLLFCQFILSLVISNRFRSNFVGDYCQILWNLKKQTD